MPKSLRSFLGFAVLAPALALGGCAKRIPDASPSEIPTLERRYAEDPSDYVTRTRLGLAYYKAGQYEAAEGVLEEADELGAEDGLTYLYLGLAREAQGDFAGAGEAYARYPELGRSDPLRRELEARVSLMTQKELERQATDALAMEDELSAQSPEPGTVAVLPFGVVAGDPALSPLGVALSDMVITDLSLSGGVTVLERAKVQTLVREMALTEAGFTEEGTGARTGRMLRAENVIQGALAQVGRSDLRFDAGVLNTEARQVRGEFSEQAALEQAFELEKALVFQALEVLGVELTPAEREAIGANRTDNLQAFLLYGEGLQALDRGEYQVAAGLFARAATEDPAFVPAQARLEEANQLQSAADTDADDLIRQSFGEEAVAFDEGMSLVAELIEDVNPNQGSGLTDRSGTQGGLDDGSRTQTGNRDFEQESGGNDGGTSRSGVDFNFPNPLVNPNLPASVRAVAPVHPPRAVVPIPRPQVPVVRGGRHE